MSGIENEDIVNPHLYFMSQMKGENQIKEIKGRNKGNNK